LVGFGLLALALVYVLASWLPLGADALVAAAVLPLVAAVLALWGKRELAAIEPGPGQTLATLEEDRAWAKRPIDSARD